MKPKVKVSPLENPYHAGDWHDPILKWTVTGPKDEVQNFSTKKDALLYAKCRRNSATFKEAGDKYLAN